MLRRTTGLVGTLIGASTLVMGACGSPVPESSTSASTALTSAVRATDTTTTAPLTTPSSTASTSSTAPSTSSTSSTSTASAASSAAPTTAPPSRATAPTSPPLKAGPRTVFVQGDSVLLGTTATLPAALAGWTVTMDCVGSRRLAQAIPVFQQRKSEIGRVVIIQLGNNYIPGEAGPFSTQIDQTMQVLSGVERVVWVTVAEANGPSRVQINQDIRAAARRWPTIVVAEWAPIIAANPQYASGGDVLHLSNSGRVAMAQLIADAVGPAPAAA